MALKAVVEKLDDIAEPFREHYRAGTPEEGTDGKFVLAVDSIGGFALENVDGLKSALGKERTTREKLERDVVKYKDLDPDKARAALTELEELKRIDPAKEADKIANTKFESAKAQLLQAHQTEIGQRDERIGKLTGSVDKLVRQAEATSAIAEAKGSVELLLPHVLANTRVKETEEGDFLTEVVDSKGNVRIGNAKGDPMTIKDLVAEMRQSATFGRAFEADGHDGQGKKPDGSPTGPTKGALDGNRQDRAAYFASKYKVPAAQ